MMYQHKKSNKMAKVIETNDKFKTVMLELEDGTTISTSLATFKRWWKKVDTTADIQAVETTETPAETTVETTDTVDAPAVDVPTTDETPAVEPVEAEKPKKQKRVYDPTIRNEFIARVIAVAEKVGIEIKTWDKIKNLYAFRVEGKTVAELYVGKFTYRVNAKADKFEREFTLVKNYYLPATIKQLAFTDNLVFELIGSFN